MKFNKRNAKSCICTRITPCTSICWKLYRKVYEGQQAEHEPEICPCGKGQQDSIRKSIISRSTEMILPLSFGEATSKVLSPVLGSPVQETWTY